MIEIPENVNAFVKQCADAVAAQRRMDFIYCQEPQLVICESPIEQLFLTALNAMRWAYGYENEEIDVGDHYILNGISVFPQHPIGRYRVDFALVYLVNGRVPINWRIKPLQSYAADKATRLIVELDGHEFHDRDEKQRRYEKARDRYLQKSGFKVFRYTGSEIYQNPSKAVAECVAYLTDDDEHDLLAGMEVRSNG